MPAGWPEEPVSRRLQGDMPVAGRPPAEYGGAPWAGQNAPRQGERPLPVEFTGGDGNRP